LQADPSIAPELKTPFHGVHRAVFWQRAIQTLVLGYFILGVVAHWQAKDGFASLIHFGEIFAPARLPELHGMPLTTYPGSGYDGQFYAQLAVAPDVTNPAVEQALDNPLYRARRILLPVVSHGLGAGRPALIIQIYALLNVAAWFVFAWWLHRRTAPHGLGGTLVWACAVLSLGVLDSVQLALTDLPATVLIIGAVVAMERNKHWLAAAALAAAGLTRETSALAAGLFAPQGWQPGRSSFSRFLAGALSLLPLAVWLLYLTRAVPAGNYGVQGNFDWPGAAMVRNLWLCGTTIFSGEPSLRHYFAPLAMIGLGYQSCYVIRHAWKGGSAWARSALPFALLFWILGDSVWGGYWAVARACLPMSVGFFLLIPYDRNLPWRLVLTALCLPHAIYRFWPDFS